MGFKDHTKKLLGLSRMAGDQYVPSEEDPETIMTTLVPVAMNIVQNHLSGSTFCDRFSIPLISLARQVQFSMSKYFLHMGNCEAQGKGRARGGPRKVTQRLFLDGGWWISFP